jgi:hypothetical protein
MRHQTTLTAIFVLAFALSGPASKEPSVQELEAKAEAARLEDRPRLYLDIAEHQLISAKESYKGGRGEEGQAAVVNVVRDAGKARDAAIQSGKRLKDTEIIVRKMAEKLRDMKRILNFDDQAPVQNAVDQLETMRTDLLSHMFGKGNR